jgi:hypothetical protein
VKILMPARHGLGDVLHGYFIAEHGRTVLAKVKAGLETGQITSAMVVYEDFYNPSVGDLFRALPLDLIVAKTSELPEVKDQDSDNRMPDSVKGHKNVFTRPPALFNGLDSSRRVACPTRAPRHDIPAKFVLFSDAAHARDRLLTDPEIYRHLRDNTGLPIVKVGRGHDAVPSDINLSNRLSIPETLFLAERATIVVSALTMLRTFSALFGKPVIELAERASTETVRRTRWEYKEGLYGMQPSLNSWYFWPADRGAIGDTIRHHMGHGK